MIKSLRTRLQWWYGTVLALTLLLFGSLVYWRANRDMRDRAVRQAVSAAEYLAVSLRPPRPQPGPGGSPPDRPPYAPHPPRNEDFTRTARPGAASEVAATPGADAGPRQGMRRPPGTPPAPFIPPSLLGDPPPDETPGRGQPPPPRPAEDRLSYIVWHPDGRRIQQVGTESPELSSMPRPAAGTGLEIQRRSDRVQVIRRGPGGLVVLVDRPLADDLAELRLFGASVGLLGVAALTVSLAGGRWVSARMVRPIETISETAKQISAARLDRRIDTQPLDAELQPLAHVLNETFARLEQSFRRLNQFTADASHELRTPLAVIQSQAELALQQPRSVSEYQQALETCLKSSIRMRSLTEGLLLLARSDAEPLQPVTEPADLRLAAEEAAAALQDRFNAAGVDLECETPEDRVSVAVDPRFLRQIAHNLLDNALQHTPQGGQVSVKVFQQQSLALMLVRDTGCGIPPEHLPQIFDRFYRVDSARSRNTGGSGLGLAICRTLTEVHCGQIHCESTPGTGTTFTVQLPLAPATKPETQA